MNDKNTEQNTELENKLKNEKRLEYANFLFIWIIRMIFIAAIVVSVVLRNVNTIIPSILGTVLVFLPVLIPRLTNFHIIPEFHLIFALFVFLAMFVGEIGLYYETVWWWDILLHTFSGFLLGLVGFSLVYFLNNAENVNISMSPFFVALFSFCFAIMCGVFWEIFEFSLDQIFGTNTQRSGLVDTMWDLIVDTVGGFSAALIGYFYLKKDKESFFIKLALKLISKNDSIRPSLVRLKDKIDRFKIEERIIVKKPYNDKKQSDKNRNNM